MKRNINDKENSSTFLSGLIGGTLSLTVSAVIVKLIGLFYKIPIASILGDEGMGYFNSAYTVYAFFYLLCTAGVPKAVMILVSEAKARGESFKVGKILKTALGLFFCVGVIFSGLLIAFSSSFAEIIGNKNAYLTIICISPSIVFVSLSGVLRGYLSAHGRLLDIAVSQIIEGVGKLGLGLILAGVGRRLNLPLESISALTIIGVCFGSVICFIYLLICLKSLKTNENIGQSNNLLNNGAIIKRILSISLPITISAAMMSLTNLIDLGLIMRSLIEIGYDEAMANALYGNYTTLAVPMLNLAISVISPIGIAFLPILTTCIISSDLEGLKTAEKSAIKLSQILCAPMMVGLIIYSEEILTMLFPNSEIQIGSILLSLISPSILFYSLLLITNTALEAKGRVRAPLISMTIGSIVKLIASYFLITKTDMGILGAPMGTMLSYASALILSMIIYAVVFKRHIPIFEGALMPHLSAFIAVILSRVIYDRLIFRLPSALCLMICIFIAALIYLGILSFCGTLKPKEIQQLAKYTNFS